MNSVVFTLTLRELLGQKRLIITVLLALVPLVLALIYSLGDQVSPQEWTTDMLESTMITVALPLICLILGTSALGSEIEDGTAVYVLAKPIPRFQIVTAKFAAAALAGVALVVPATFLSGALALSGAPTANIPLAFTAGAAVAAVAYAALFVLMSVVTSRALIVGLAYVFIWEGLITNIFSAVAYVSVREYSLGVTDSLTDTVEWNAELGSIQAIVLFLVLTVGAVAFAARRLETIELRETD